MLPTTLTATIWNRLCNRGGRIRLDKLPTDILVDEILARLDVKDILALREVSKSFHLLTKQSALWKRFVGRLSSLPHPLPTLPPSASYSLKQLSPLCLERLVTRSISLDNNWRSPNPRPFSTFIVNAFDEMTEVTMLPGGHYLVAAMKEACGQRAVVVWAMEHQLEKPGTKMGPIALAVHYVKGKPYGLKAKYMQIKGKKGIVIAYTTKRLKGEGDMRDIPETIELGSSILTSADPTDPTLAIKYEVEAIFVSLSALDTLTTRRLNPQFERLQRESILKKGAIEVIASVRTGRAVVGIAMGEVCVGPAGDADEERMPILCVAKSPNTILFEEMCTGRRTALECLPPPELERYPHYIMNIQLLPSQRQVMAVREGVNRRPNRSSFYTVELYNIPPFEPSPQPVNPKVYRTLRYKPLQSLSYDDAYRIRNVQISEPDVGGVAPWDPSVRKVYAYNNEKGKGRPPMPLSVYFRNDDGLTHLSLWPTELKTPMTPRRTPSPPLNTGSASDSSTPRQRQTRYFYTLDRTVLKSAPFTRTRVLRTLPGSHRAMVLAIPPRTRVMDPPVTGVYAYLYDGARRTIVGDRFGVNDAGIWGVMAGVEGWGTGAGPAFQEHLAVGQQPPHGNVGLAAALGQVHGQNIVQLFDPLDLDGDELAPFEQEAVDSALRTTTNMEAMPPLPPTPPTPTLPLMQPQLAASSSSSTSGSPSQSPMTPLWPDARMEPSQSRNRFAEVHLHGALVDEMKKGVLTCCWDEESGRMVVVTSGSRERRRKMWVLEFGYGRRTDEADRRLLDEMLDSISAEEALPVPIEVD